MKRFIALAAAALLFAGCGGSSGSTAIPAAPSSSSATPSAQKGAVDFVVKIPAKPTGAAALNHRSPQWITSSVQGVQISAVNTTTGWSGVNFYPVGASQSYCTSGSSGLTCTLALTAPPGNDLFTIVTYDTPNLAGNPISDGTLTANIVSGQANSISIVTGGVVDNIAATVDNPYPAPSATTIPVRTIAADPDGYIIVGPFDTALTVSDSDTSGATTPSVTSIPDSATLATLTIAYNGTSLASPATITVQATSVYSGSVITQGVPTQSAFTLDPGGIGLTLSPSLLVFASNANNTAAQSFTVGGGTAPYSATNGSDGCDDDGYIFQNGCVTLSGSSPTYSIVPTGWGPFIDTLPVSDSASHTATETIFVP